VLKRFIATCLVLPLLLAALLAVPARSWATSPPAAQDFRMSQFAVTAGSSVSLHWNTGANQFFFLTSTAPTFLPKFSSSSVVTWPQGSRASWNGTYNWWRTTSGAVMVAIPADAAPGTTYAFQLYTCDSSSNLCSNSADRSGDSHVTLTVAAKWTTTSYKNDFSTASVVSQVTGHPLDVVFSPDDIIWNSSEFSDSLGKLSIGAGLKSYVDPTDTGTDPFAYCFSNCRPASASSALSEQIIYANGLIWFTQGGWPFYDCSVSHSQRTCPPNHSEVVAFNPTTNNFCSYLVPGDNNEVMGLAATGTAPDDDIWFVESNIEGGKPNLDYFNPAEVGDGCPGTTSESYSLSGLVHRIIWPGNNFPSQIAVDPSGSALWVSDFWGSSIARVDLRTHVITSHHLASHNSYSFFGSDPWQVAADANYVYAIDYGDSNLDRINKKTGHVDQVSIPLLSDTERGYGLAISGSRLYFTLSDDDRPSFGYASTVGYVDIGTWAASSPSPTTAVVYTGLSEVTDPTSSNVDFRGIAASSDGLLAIADLANVIRLSPRGLSQG